MHGRRGLMAARQSTGSWTERPMVRGHKAKITPLGRLEEKEVQWELYSRFNIGTSHHDVGDDKYSLLWSDKYI
jgi:hypothetical protein